MSLSRHSQCCCCCCCGGGWYPQDVVDMEVGLISYVSEDQPGGRFVIIRKKERYVMNI